jgi:tetratricopeptide (TPR) repeat protein
MRKFQEGLQQFEIALKLPNEEQNVWVYSNMADLYEAMGDNRMAVLCTEKQLENFPNSKVLLEDLARQCEKTGDYQRAIQLYEKLKDNQHITEDRCMSYIAYCYYLSGAYRTAKKYYLKAIKTIEKKGKNCTKRETINLIDCYQEYGDFCRDISKFKDALAAYLHCVELAEPVDLEYARDRIKDVAWVYYDMGNMQKAAFYAKKYLDMINKLSGDVEQWVMANPLFCVGRAASVETAYLLAGDLEQAEKYQQITMRNPLCYHCKYPQCYEGYYGAGLLMEAKGELQKAAELFQQALNIKPVYEESRRALNRVLKVLK